ncbi:MAG: ferritin-like domain-containing protein [Bacteroidota bacterium]
MNIFKIIQDIEQVDPEVYERLNSRRSAFNFLGKAAIAAAPLALGSIFQKAYGKTNDAVTDVLNFALTLEYLESEFYTMGLASTMNFGNQRAAFMQISKHETAHVALLKGALGANAVSKPTFDFTAKGNFLDVFTNLATFTTLAQAFEDTGVRAYKGQAGNLMTNKDVLTIALQIHSVEARHASFVRRYRGQKGWISGKDGGNIPAAAQAIYNGEENTTQGGATKAMYAAIYPDALVSEAFDEPLAKEDVLTIAKLFIV